VFVFGSENSTMISTEIPSYELLFQRSLLGLKYIVEETREDRLSMDRHCIGRDSQDCRGIQHCLWMARDQVTFFVQVGRACTVYFLFFSLFP